ncbi:hypothetical protein D3C76_1663900 [compost metagenome]
MNDVNTLQIPPEVEIQARVDVGKRSQIGKHPNTLAALVVIRWRKELEECVRILLLKFQILVTGIFHHHDYATGNIFLPWNVQKAFAQILKQ